MNEQHLLDVLRVFGEIAHWTVTPAFDVGNCSCPPIVTWRYEHPTNRASDFFRNVVSAYCGAVSWDFSITQRTWCLMPSRVKEYATVHEELGGLGAAEELMRTDPEFGKRANADLCFLVQHIQQQIACRE